MLDSKSGIRTTSFSTLEGFSSIGKTKLTGQQILKKLGIGFDKKTVNSAYAEEIQSLYYSLILKKVDDKVITLAIKKLVDTNSYSLNKDKQGFRPAYSLLDRSIVVPYDYESNLIHPLLMNLITISGVFGIGISKSGDTKSLVIKDESGDLFFEGFFSELRVSKSKISKIGSIDSKTQPYQAGSRCARWEIVKSLLKIRSIPQKYWRSISDTISGSTSSKQRKYLSKVCSLYTVPGVLERSLSTLIVSYVNKNIKRFMKRVDLKNFIFSSSDVASLVSRKVKSMVKVSKNKSMTIRKSVKPTKPSTLASVFHVERLSVGELTDKPWITTLKVSKDFDSKDVEKRDYPALEKELDKLQKIQWEMKNIILISTKFRMVDYISKDIKDKPKRIQQLRKICSDVVDLSSIDSCKSIIAAYNAIIPRLHLVDSKKFQILDLRSFLDSKSMKNMYPITAKLLMDASNKIHASSLKKK